MFVCVFGGALDHDQQRHTSCLRGRESPPTSGATEAPLRDQPLCNYSHDQDDYSISSVQWLVFRMWSRLGLLFNSHVLTGAIIRAYIM